MGKIFRTAIFLPLLISSSCTTQLSEICQKEWANIDQGLTRVKEYAKVAGALDVGAKRSIASLDDGAAAAELKVAEDAKADVLSELAAGIRRAQWAQDVATENNARSLKGDLAQLVVQLVSAYGYAEENLWKRFDGQLTRVSTSAEKIREKACSVGTQGK